MRALPSVGWLPPEPVLELEPPEPPEPEPLFSSPVLHPARSDPDKAAATTTARAENERRASMVDSSLASAKVVGTPGARARSGRPALGRPGRRAGAKRGGVEASPARLEREAHRRLAMGDSPARRFWMHPDRKKIRSGGAAP